MNGDEGGYGVGSFDPGHDVKRKKGGYDLRPMDPNELGAGGQMPPPMDSPFGGGFAWGTDFTPDPGVPDPIPPQAPPGDEGGMGWDQYLGDQGSERGQPQPEIAYPVPPPPVTENWQDPFPPPTGPPRPSPPPPPRPPDHGGIVRDLREQIDYGDQPQVMRTSMGGQTMYPDEGGGPAHFPEPEQIQTQDLGEISGVANRDPHFFGQNQPIDASQEDYGYGGLGRRYGGGTDPGMSNYMGSGIMPGGDEAPYAGDATEVYGGSNVRSPGNTQGAQPAPIWDWEGKPAGMKDWMYANQPTQLDFNWQSGKGDWWAAPSDWGDEINTIRATGQHPRGWADRDWMGGSPGGIPESAYSWRPGTTPPPATMDIPGLQKLKVVTRVSSGVILGPQQQPMVEARTYRLPERVQPKTSQITTLLLIRPMSSGRQHSHLHQVPAVEAAAAEVVVVVVAEQAVVAEVQEEEVQHMSLHMSRLHLIQSPHRRRTSIGRIRLSTSINMIQRFRMLKRRLIQGMFLVKLMPMIFLLRSGACSRQVLIPFHGSCSQTWLCWAQPGAWLQHPWLRMSNQPW